MSLKHYLNNRLELPLLKRFAFLGSNHTPGCFDKKLQYLASIAEEESWHHLDQETDKEQSVLFYYIVHTFDRCFMQEKITINKTETEAFFNTGLLTSQGAEIYGHFERNLHYTASDPHANFWYLKGFVKENDRIFMQKCPKKPALATFYDHHASLHFNPELPIKLNFDHMIHDNFHRLPESIKALNTQTIVHILEGSIQLLLKKIRRNYRLPVPQYYDGRIMFLVPLDILPDETIIIALEKIHNEYIANTVLTLPMAYNCARLIHRPDKDWLTQMTP